jgi:hypothetical protein
VKPPRIVTVRRNIEGLIGAIDVTKARIVELGPEIANKPGGLVAYLEHCERELAKRCNELARLEQAAAGQQ